MQKKTVNILAVILIATLPSCSILRKNKEKSEETKEYSTSEIVEFTRNNNIVKKGVFIKEGTIKIKTTEFEGSFSFYAKINSMQDFAVFCKGPFELELLRIYGVNDSIYVVDRINKAVYCGLKSKLLKKYGLPENFWDYLLGDLTESKFRKDEQGSTREYLKIYSDNKDAQIETRIDIKSLKTAETILRNERRLEYIAFRYENYYKEGIYEYPARILADSEKPMFHVEINIKSIKIPFNEIVKPRIPDYKIISL